MTFNIDDLKKKIIYRSTYRGTKEMDLLLGNFVKRNIYNSKKTLILIKNDEYYEPIYQQYLRQQQQQKRPCNARQLNHKLHPLSHPLFVLN